MVYYSAETKQPPLQNAYAPRFHAGRIVATPAALEALGKTGENPLYYLARHFRGDWGDVDEHDWCINDSAITSGARILSAYTLRDGTTIWIITDAEIDNQHHRQATTILLPEEY